MTRKAPTGGKHAPCVMHVPHTYTSNGWLCVNDEPGRAEAMVEFADHLAEVAARHRLAEADRPSAVETVKARKARAKYRRPAEYGPTTLNDCLVFHRCAWSHHDEYKDPKIRAKYLNASGRCIACAWKYPDRPHVYVESAGTIAEGTYLGPYSGPLIGPYLAELDAGSRPILPADAFTPRTDPGRIEPAARIKVVPVQEVAMVEPVKSSVKARKTSTRHVHATADGSAVFVGDACAECGHTPIGPDPAYVSAVPESRIISPGRSSVPVAELVAQMGPDIAERAAAFVLEHPMHDLEAVAGSISRADAILAAPRVKSIAEPARTTGEPVSARPPLSILPDARAQDDRPRCARCGQTFRKSGTGAAWHLVNRLDCAAEYRRATA